jgi:Ca2+-binding RTX toxin-like protein
MRKAIGLVAVATILGLAMVSVIPGVGASTAGGGRPACTIRGTSGDDDPLRGTPGPDVICGGRGSDFIDGRGGDDLIFGGPGSDFIIAHAGDDVVRGGAGSDVDIFGGFGDDRLFGGTGRDDVRGEAGRDLISGGPGGDFCLSAIDGHGGDRVRGGSGIDNGDRDPGDHVRSVERVTPYVCFGE